jgi:hypothetical protein
MYTYELREKWHFLEENATQQSWFRGTAILEPLEWDRTCLCRRLKGAQTSKWAYLPVGPLERQLREGIQGGFWEEVRKRTLKKE